MNFYLNGTKLFFESIPKTVRKHRKKLWLGFILLTLLMVTGIPRIVVDASILSYFRKDEPIRQAYDQFRSTFGSDEVLYIVYKPKDGDVLSEASLKAVQGIQEELLNYRKDLKAGETSPLDHITDVTTVINASYLEAGEGALISRDFIGKKIPTNAESRDHLRKQGLREPNYPGILFSEDFRWGGIVIETDFNAVPLSVNGASVNQEELGLEDDGLMLDSTEEIALVTATSRPEHPGFKENVIKDYVPFMNEMLKIINQPKYKEHLTFYPVGTPPFMHFVSEMIINELGLIALGALLLITLVALVLFRNPSAVVWLLLIVVTSLIWLMGCIGWSGVVMPDLIIIIVFFMLAVGVADAIHILSGYLYFRKQAVNHSEALTLVYHKSGLACFLTSLTTTIGFFSMLFVPIVTMQKIGLFAGMGALIAFIVTIVFLPLMLDIWSPVKKQKSVTVSRSPEPPHLIQKGLQKLETFGYHYSGRTIIIFTIITIVFGFGITKIRVESSNIEIIKKGEPIRIAFNMADRYLGGTDNLEILVDTGKTDGLKDPKVLQMMESLQERIETEYSDIVTITISLADVAKSSYRALNDGKQRMFVIPEEPLVLAQTLFLFNNANLEDRRELVSDDYRLARITVRAKSLNSVNSKELMAAVDRFTAEYTVSLKNDYPDLTVSVTGQIPLRMKMFDYISWSQIISFGVTLGVISLLLLVVFGSPKIGLIAIIPNLFPVIIAAGTMGYLGIPLEIHTLMVVPIVIGLAVDDTIHFMTHFRLELQTHGNVKDAIVNTYREVGQAIVFTSLILAIGFLMFLISKNQGFWYFGVLNALAVLTAVIADLILLPAILQRHFKTSPLLESHQLKVNLSQKEA